MAANSMVQGLTEALAEAALKTVIELLQDADPFVRLNTAMYILDSLEPSQEVDEEEQFTYDGEPPILPDRDDLAELDEFDPTDERDLAARQALAAADGAMLPATPENMERVMAQLALGADVPVETHPDMPPGYRPGHSGIGSGEGKGSRGSRKRKGHGRR